MFAQVFDPWAGFLGAFNARKILRLPVMADATPAYRKRGGTTIIPFKGVVFLKD